MLFRALRFCVLLGFGAFVLVSAAAYAEEDASPLDLEVSEEKIEEAERKAKAAMEAREKAYGMMLALTDRLEGHEKQHFHMLYTHYNLIQTVKVVQADVADAIAQCGENNPDMEEGLDTRFGAWNDAVNPVMEEADGHLNNMIIAQDYAPEPDIRKILDALDMSRKKAADQITKIPVTTPEACTFLQEKMDETQDRMLGLLRRTLISFPKAFHESGGEVSEEADAAQDGEAETQDSAPDQDTEDRT